MRQPIHLELHVHKAIADSSWVSETGIITDPTENGEQCQGAPTQGRTPYNGATLNRVSCQTHSYNHPQKFQTCWNS